MKSLKSLTLAALVLASLAACAPKHMIAQDSRPTVAPKPAVAQLVVIRDGSLCFFLTVDEYLDGKLMGQTHGKSYFVTEVPAGTHYVSARGNSTDTVRMNFEPGRVYFLGVGMYPGGFIDLYTMPAERALADMASPSLTYRIFNKQSNVTLPDADYKAEIDALERAIKNNPEKYKEMLQYKGVDKY